MGKKIIIFLIMGLMLLGLLCSIKVNDAMKDEVVQVNENHTLNRNFKTKIKSGNLSTDYTISEALSDIKNLNLNTVNIPIMIKIKSRTSSDMAMDYNSRKKAEELIGKLRGENISVILEAYPWIEDGNVGETYWKPDNIDKFFENWKENVLEPMVSKVANKYNVDAISIGTSFVNMEQEEDKMCKLADFVRKRYNGLITYRTNFWCTAEFKPELNDVFLKKISNKVFSKLDFISIASYFELTENETNTVDNLVNALECSQIYNRKQNIVEEMKMFHDKWDKPIFFGELGFPKTNKASVEPWNVEVSDIINEEEQARCFQAYRTKFENCDWNLGFSVFAIGQHGEDKRYYPSEESARVIREWY